MPKPELDIEGRRAGGRAIFSKQLGIPEAEVMSLMRDTFGADFMDEACIGMAPIWTDETLSMRDRSLLVIASLVSQGGLEPRLRSHLRWSVRNGATRAEVEELMKLLAFYAGYPKASTGMQVLIEELGPEEAR